MKAKASTQTRIDPGFHATLGGKHIIVELYMFQREINLTVRESGKKVKQEYPKTAKTANMQVKYYRDLARSRGYCVEDFERML